MCTKVQWFYSGSTVGLQ